MSSVSVTVPPNPIGWLSTFAPVDIPDHSAKAVNDSLLFTPPPARNTFPLKLATGESSLDFGAAHFYTAAFKGEGAQVEMFHRTGVTKEELLTALIPFEKRENVWLTVDYFVRMAEVMRARSLPPELAMLESEVLDTYALTPEDKGRLKRRETRDGGTFYHTRLYMAEPAGAELHIRYETPSGNVSTLVLEGGFVRSNRLVPANNLFEPFEYTDVIGTFVGHVKQSRDLLRSPSGALASEITEVSNDTALLLLSTVQGNQVHGFDLLTDVPVYVPSNTIGSGTSQITGEVRGLGLKNVTVINQGGNVLEFLITTPDATNEFIDLKRYQHLEERYLHLHNELPRSLSDTDYVHEVVAGCGYSVTSRLMMRSLVKCFAAIAANTSTKFNIFGGIVNTPLLSQMYVRRLYNEITAFEMKKSFEELPHGLRSFYLTGRIFRANLIVYWLFMHLATHETLPKLRFLRATITKKGDDLRAYNKAVTAHNKKFLSVTRVFPDLDDLSDGGRTSLSCVIMDLADKVDFGAMRNTVALGAVPYTPISM